MVEGSYEVRLEAYRKLRNHILEPARPHSSAPVMA